MPSQTTPEYQPNVVLKQCVAPPEILTLIFEEIDLATPPRSLDSNLRELHSTRKSLLAAALTCTDFCPLALDILWRTIDNLSPLLRLLPALKPINGVNTLSGQIEPADWARFRCYAKRVRRVMYPGDALPLPTHPSVYPALAMLHQTPLFPNLVSIECTSARVDASSPFPEALLLLSPTIRHVEISALALDLPSTTIFLSTLAGVSSQLSSLTLRNQSYAVLEAIALPFPCLRELDLTEMVGAMSTDFLKALSNLTILASLSIDLNFPDFPSVLSVAQTVGPCSFSALKRLHIRCSSDTILAISLRLITSRGLHTLVIDGRSTSQVHLPWSITLCQEIADRWPYSLRRLEISNLVSNLVPAPTSCLELFALRSLNIFTLRNSPALSFAGVTLSDIAKAWPEITSLSIPSLPGVTISNLAVLAQNCPQLTDLEISLTAAIPVPPLSTTPVCGHALRALTVCDSPCSPVGVQILSRHLDRLFPRLQSVRSEDRDSARWAEVESLIFTFQDVRLHALAQS
ncbi:hypothetical protein FB451DRAFT_1053586 [Mycena latifolia]|nr:hypothetical protein FB451DRAFT_1053586 [Mycena latifolia]